MHLREMQQVRLYHFGVFIELLAIKMESFLSV